MLQILKNVFLATAAFLVMMGLTGCDQFVAKNFGGDYTVNLPAGEKLVNITWKENALWYLTRPMTDEEEPETYKFKEDSQYGLMEGTVTIIEHK